MSKLCVEADDGRSTTDNGRTAAGYRIQKQEPTQRCGKKVILSYVKAMIEYESLWIVALYRIWNFPPFRLCRLQDPRGRKRTTTSHLMHPPPRISVVVFGVVFVLFSLPQFVTVQLEPLSSTSYFTAHTNYRTEPQSIIGQTRKEKALHISRRCSIIGSACPRRQRVKKHSTTN